MDINLNDLVNEAVKRRTAELPQTGPVCLGLPDPVEMLVDQMRGVWYSVMQCGGRPTKYILGLREIRIIRIAARRPVFFHDKIVLDGIDVGLDDWRSCIGVIQ